MFGLVIIILASLLPVVFWAYIFSYIDATLANRRRFIVGILAGVISIFPILALGKINYFSRFPSLDVFSSLLRINVSGGIGELIGAIGVTLIGVFILGIVGGVFQQTFFKNRVLFGKNILFFSLTLGIFGLLFILLQSVFLYIPKIDTLESGVSLGVITLNSLKLVILYYLIIGLLEESSKHFQFLGSGIGVNTSLKEMVLFAIFVALGFSFAENILYLKGLSDENGGIAGIWKIYLFRSTLSLMLHVVCSSIIAHMLGLLWWKGGRRIFSRYGTIFFAGIIGSIFLHAFFDISLTFGFNIIAFFYFIGGYLYVSSIFYKENEELL